MKLMFGDTLIFDDLAQAYSIDMTVSGELLTQIVRTVRAPNAGFRDRGNRYSDIRFSVTRKWDSLRLAEEHYLLHPQTVSAKAAAVFTLGTGGDTSTVTGADSILTAVASSRKGVSTRFNYTLQVPELVLSA